MLDDEMKDILEKLDVDLTTLITKCRFFLEKLVNVDFFEKPYEYDFVEKERELSLSAKKKMK